MSGESGKVVKFGSVIVVILLAISYLAYTGVQESKSYYVTIKELGGMGDSAYTKRLRVAGNVQTGSIRRTGLHLNSFSSKKAASCPWCIPEPMLRLTL